VHRIGRTGRAGRQRHRDQLRARRPGRRGPTHGGLPRPHREFDQGRGGHERRPDPRHGARRSRRRRTKAAR
jgi:hypothetical protein